LAPDAVESETVSDPGCRSWIGRSLVKRAVGTMLVVMADVDREHSFEVPAVHDQESAENAVPAENSCVSRLLVAMYRVAKVRPDDIWASEIQPTDADIVCGLDACL
jgi:hypothetical protein